MKTMTTVMHPRKNTLEDPDQLQVIAAWLHKNPKTFTLSLSVVESFRCIRTQETKKKQHGIRVTFTQHRGYPEFFVNRGNRLVGVYNDPTRALQEWGSLLYRTARGKRLTAILPDEVVEAFKETLKEYFPGDWQWEDKWGLVAWKQLTTPMRYPLFRFEYDPVALEAPEDMDEIEYDEVWDEPCFDLFYLMKKEMKQITTDDIRKFVTANFGKRRTNRPLIREVMEALASRHTIPALLTAKQLKNHFDADNLAGFLRDLIEVGYVEYVKVTYGGVSVANLAEIISEASVTRKRRILLEAVQDRLLTRDTVRMYQQLHNAGIDIPNLHRRRSLRELHDSLIPEFNRIADEQRRQRELERIERDAAYRERMEALNKFREAPLNQEKYKDLEEVTINGWIIRSPKVWKEIGNWGRELSHCIGSYADEVITNPKLTLFAIHDEQGHLIANAAIDSGRLRQLYGRGNSRVDRELVESFLVAAYHHNLISDIEGSVRASNMFCRD